jgi:hypothetical protein
VTNIEPTGLEPANSAAWPDGVPAVTAATSTPAPGALSQPAPAFSDADKAFLAALVRDAVNAQTLPAAPAPKAERTTELKTGSLVSVSHESSKGRVTQHGIVVKLLADADGKPGRAQVAWFGGLSGPIDVEDLDDEAF